MFGLSDDRYYQLSDHGVADYTIADLIRLYGIDVVQKGYWFCHQDAYQPKKPYCPGASYVEHIAQLAAFDSDWDACRQAEKDGVKFINDMDGLQKGFYVDTPENRKICAQALQKHPDLRIENWLDVDDGEWGSRYAEYFSEPMIIPREEKIETTISPVSGFKTGSVVSVAHFAETDDVKNAVLLSDTLRSQALDVCDRIPGYAALPLAEKNRLYDLVKKAVSLSHEKGSPTLENAISKQNDTPNVNTKIFYLYRDADNYKVHNECVVEGVITEEQQKMILGCLDDGCYFIPSLVGLPEEKFDEVDDPEVDHQWFELEEGDFADTSESATVSISANELVEAFLKCKDRWMDEYFNTPSLAEQIRSASTRAANARSTSDLKIKELEPDR